MKKNVIRKSFFGNSCKENIHAGEVMFWLRVERK